MTTEQTLLLANQSEAAEGLMSSATSSFQRLSHVGCVLINPLPFLSHTCQTEAAPAHITLSYTHRAGVVESAEWGQHLWLESVAHDTMFNKGASVPVWKGRCERGFQLYLAAYLFCTLRFSRLPFKVFKTSDCYEDALSSAGNTDVGDVVNNPICLWIICPESAKNLYIHIV